MIEWYAREIRGLIENRAIFGKCTIEKRALRREYGNLTKGLELFICEVDKLAREFDLKFEIRTREGPVLSRLYFVQWTPREKNKEPRWPLTSDLTKSKP